MSGIIKLEELTKTYRSFNRREGVWGSVKDLLHRDYFDVKAVDGISLDVPEGELLGYIGPNGAGKSTSIKMLTGILKPSSGSMQVNGYHPFRDRKAYTRQIGVVFGQRTQLWWDIAVIESFRLLSKIYDVRQVDFDARLKNLSEILELEALLRLPVRKLSLGQRMRCDLAASLLHNPKLLFLDEPTIGLDAVAKDSIRDFLRAINRDFGTTIILTTHDLKEIEELCQRIVVLDKGKIIYDGSLVKVKAMPGLKRSIVIDFAGKAPLEELSTLFQGRAQFSLQSERRLVGEFAPEQLPAAEVVRTVLDRHEVADLTITEPSIEQVIVKLYRDGANGSRVAGNG
ncbi:MAG: ATP-binding cassette domain-containing protein [Bdellovibrionales bacterium]|nr:ATP-binding cassette domain-containing protein [Bdellovibrionales bacterium]